MDLGTDGHRLAIEALATLAHIKSSMVEFILAPAGVPARIYGPILKKTDPLTGKLISKRKAAPLILAEMAKLPSGPGVVRRIIEIAAKWDQFHVADNEYEARATVQKAQALLGVLQVAEAREQAARELAIREERERLERESAERMRKEREAERIRVETEAKERAATQLRHQKKLLDMFDHLTSQSDRQGRGYLLQQLLTELFDLHSIPVLKSFTRNEGGEQIDGAFKLEGWHYLVECRWREKLADIRQLDGLQGQVARSGKQTMGLFLSIEGWSEHVCPLLKQNPDKNIFLMEGYDLRTVLTGQVDLRELLLGKLAALNLRAEPYWSVAEHLASQKGSGGAGPTS